MPRRVVLALSTIFNVRGGIPRFNQMLCAAVDEVAPDLDLRGTVISQDDSLDDYRASGARWEHLDFVAGGGQLGLTWRTLATCVRRRQDLLLMGLLGMAPVGLLCRPWLRRGYGFVAHGAEVWEEPRLSRRFSASRARFALAVSRHTKASVERTASLPEASVLLLHNTLSPNFEHHPEEPEDPEDPEEPATDAAELLVVCRLWAEEKKKGVDHTIDAFSRLAARHPSAGLRIVGKGSDLPRLERIAADLGVAGRVRFEQDLSDDELARRYRRCAAFVMPSGQEGFGIVFLEAMRFGKPCVGGAEGGTPDVIEDGETGFLVPFGDVPALVAALDRLLSDPALRRRMGRAGLERLERRFLYEHFVRTVHDHLRDLLGTA